jgi:hypothetical protein
MSSNNSSTSTFNDSGSSYEITSSGTNSEGNHYDSRDYGSGAANDNSYHYSNKYSIIIFEIFGSNANVMINSDGSYYYSNPDGSTYYNSGSGYSDYTPPQGK